MRLLLIALISSMLLAACASAPPEPSADADGQLEALYEREWAWRQNQWAKERNEAGEWIKQDRLPDMSAEAWDERLAYWDQTLTELDAIPADELGHDASINAACSGRSLRLSRPMLVTAPLRHR